MSEASPRGAEGEEGEYCLRLMLSDWKVVTPSAPVARTSFLWGFLGRIGIVMYHCTDIDITQGEAVSEAGPRGAGGVGGLYCL